MTEAEIYDQIYAAILEGDAVEFERLLRDHPSWRR